MDKMKKLLIHSYECSDLIYQLKQRMRAEGDTPELEALLDETYKRQDKIIKEFKFLKNMNEIIIKHKIGSTPTKAEISKLVAEGVKLPLIAEAYKISLSSVYRLLGGTKTSSVGAWIEAQKEEVVDFIGLCRQKYKPNHIRRQDLYNKYITWYADLSPRQKSAYKRPVSMHTFRLYLQSFIDLNGL